MRFRLPTKALVFVIAIKTIPALSYLTNQPQQKFKLAQNVKHSVPETINRHSTGRTTDGSTITKPTYPIIPQVPGASFTKGSICKACCLIHQTLLGVPYPI